MNPELLKILCCPETKLSLTEMNSGELEVLNEKINQGLLKNVGGEQVEDLIEGALLRSDKKIAYLIRQEIPVMLVNEGIVLS
jgi:uncharacterized protein YbaR (Trm112 family)